MNTVLVAADASCKTVDSVGSLIGLIIFGAVIGALARLVLPGKQSISVLVTVILGVLGALVGYFLSGMLGVCSTGGIDWIRWVISIAVSALFIVVYGLAMGRKQV